MTYRRWGAVTAVTKLKRCQRLRLLAVFAFGNATNILIRPLLQMKVIALARWTLWPDARHPTYLLFETNWSGSDQTYIPDFGRIMPRQWQAIWGCDHRVSRCAAHDRTGQVGRRHRRRGRSLLDRL